MTGLHNVSNALIAIQTGLTYGMTLADATAALADFAPTALRSDRMTVGSWHIIRDYYNANPEAMRASLQALQTIAGSAPKIAVLGNMNELGDYAADSHHALGVLCKETVDAALFYGPNHSDFAAGYGSADTAFAEQSDLLEALRRLLAGYGDTPLYLLVKGSRGMHMEYVLDGLLGDTE